MIMERTSNKLYVPAICVVLALATFIAFEPVRHNEFINNYDDDDYVTKNPHVIGGLTRESVIWAFTTPHVANWHPLTWLSHMVDCQLFGLDSFWHHLSSLLLHTANTLLLFWILQRMTSAVWLSGLVAAAFALHPLHVESVAWVAERKDVLSGFFWMLTMAAYLRYAERPGIGRFLLVFLAFGLGLMAKSMLVTLPFMLLLLDYWPLGRFGTVQGGINSKAEAKQTRGAVYQRSTFLGLVTEKIPLFALTVISCVVTYLVQQSKGAVASMEVVELKVRLANAVVCYSNYIGKMIWPSRLAALYPYHGIWSIWRIAEAALVLAGVSAIVASLWRRRPYLTVGWLWYLGTLVPVIGLVQVGQQSMADRYTYVPLIGLFIMIAWGAADYVKGRRYPKIAVAVPVGVLLAMTVCTRQQVSYWRNSVTLFEHTLAVTSGNYVAHTNLGLALTELGEPDKAIEHYRKALQIYPNYTSARTGLGLALAKRGELDKAVEQHREVLRLDPNSASAHIGLGLALAKQGESDKAIEYYRKALRLEPDSALAHTNLGMELMLKHNYTEAVKHYQEALRIEPDDPAVHNNLGTAILSMHGEPAAAAEQFRKALRLKPDFDIARVNLATTLTIQGKIDEAIWHCQELLRLNPNDSRAQQALKAVLAERRGQKTEQAEP